MVYSSIPETNRSPEPAAHPPVPPAQASPAHTHTHSQSCEEWSALWVRDLMKYPCVLVVALGDGGVACVSHDDSHFNTWERSPNCTWTHMQTHTYLLQYSEIRWIHHSEWTDNVFQTDTNIDKNIRCTTRGKKGSLPERFREHLVKTRDAHWDWDPAGCSRTKSRCMCTAVWYPYILL